MLDIDRITRLDLHVSSTLDVIFCHLFIYALYIVADHTLQYNSMKCGYKYYTSKVYNIMNINIIGVYYETKYRMQNRDK